MENNEALRDFAFEARTRAAAVLRGEGEVSRGEFFARCDARSGADVGRTRVEEDQDGGCAQEDQAQAASPRIFAKEEAQAQRRLVRLSSPIPPPFAAGPLLQPCSFPSSTAHLVYSHPSPDPSIAPHPSPNARSTPTRLHPLCNSRTSSNSSLLLPSLPLRPLLRPHNPQSLPHLSRTHLAPERTQRPNAACGALLPPRGAEGGFRGARVADCVEEDAGQEDGRDEGEVRSCVDRCEKYIRAGSVPGDEITSAVFIASSRIRNDREDSSNHDLLRTTAHWRARQQEGRSRAKATHLVEAASVEAVVAGPAALGGE